MTTTVVHRYEPRGGAARLFEDRSQEILLSGPAGTGKSRACLEKLHLAMLKYPGARGVILRKTQTSLGSTALVTYRRHVASEAIANGTVRWYGGSQQEAAQYRYSNGSTITVGGMDKSTKIMSSEYDMAYVQEAIELTVDDWEAITTRLRNGRLPYQQLIADTNPSMPTHWLKQRADRGDTVLIESRHEDNPTLIDAAGVPTPYGADYLAKLDKLTGVRRYRLKDGLWVAAEGIIYEDFDPALHVIPRFTIPGDWSRWWSVDFGFTNPFVWQDWAEDPDGRLYLVREIYRTRTLVEDHARRILGIVAPAGVWQEPRPRAVICDHDAEDRATLQKHLGMSTAAARKEVSPGIQAVATRWRPAGDGRPRMFMLADALVERDPELDEAKKPASTAEELPGYVWAVKPGNNAGLKEEPVKADDHGADALRYMVAARDLGSRPGIRWM